MIWGPNWNIADVGWPVLALAGVITILTSLVFLPLGFFFLGLMFWLRHLLHVPNRRIEANDQAIFAPCDGVILEIVSDIFPSEFPDDVQPAKRVTIQTRLYDIQLQTSPITEHVVDNHLIPGLFTKWGDCSASWQAARLVNERREIRIRDSFDRDVVIVQMGTKTARQLICRLAEGKFLQAGSPIGMSRIAGVVDLYIPSRCKTLSVAGQQMIAGETALAEFSSKRSVKKQSPSKED